MSTERSVNPRRGVKWIAGSGAAISGSVAFAAGATVLSLYTGLEGDAATRQFLLSELRIPRALIGLLVGATLGLVGAAFQTLFKNPLATPSTVGTTAGAALGALAALVLGWEGIGLLSAATVFAFGGALAATSVVVAVAASGRARMGEVLLAGIAVTLAAGAIGQALHVLADRNSLFAAAHWALGQLPQVGYDRVLLASGPCLVSAALLLARRRSLGVMLLGEDWARSMGVDTKRVRLEVLLSGCLGVAACVALCGPVAFVGLLVPHLVRAISGAQPARLLLLSWIVGAGFLVMADLLARSILPDRELPVGVLTSALGAPALLVVVLRRRDAT